MSDLDRRTLSQFLPNQEAVRAFEKALRDVSETLPAATASAQSTADEALIMVGAKASSEALRLLLDMVSAYVLAQRTDRALIGALERRVAELESELHALPRRGDIDQLRRQFDELQSLQAKR